MHFTQRNSYLAEHDVGDWEPLPVKLAFGEWTHWLEGSEEPFMVWIPSSQFPVLWPPSHQVESIVCEAQLHQTNGWLTHPISPSTQEHPEHWTSSRGISGGLKRTVTP